ncbi:MAG TPA: DUF6152 family protein [Vicinamibacterales bacterium]|nr:DUF6152 family protein [Vicinamibacterales bacterium]
MTRISIALCIALFAAAGVHAHHSFAAYYFEEQTVTIEGSVTEFEYRSPHAWLHVLAPDADGQMQRFSAEWANPQRLARDGVTADRFSAGDVVRITGSPGRTASERKIHLKRIERPADGWVWGGTGRGGRGGRPRR